MTIIGLAGYAGAGKDEAANLLVGQGYERVGFADGLRSLMAEVNPTVKWGATYLPWNEALDILGYRRAKDETTGRKIMQDLGNGVRNVIGLDAWVDAATRWLVKDSDYVFIDVRFPNEAQRIRDLGGLVFRIERPGVGPIVNSAGEVDISETALDGWDFDGVIHNDGTIKDLHDDLDLAVWAKKAVGATTIVVPAAVFDRLRDVGE